jgi:Tol biopolymer transport system component
MHNVILVAAIVGLQPFTRAEPLKPTNLSPLNTEKDEDDPYVSSDGLTLYYASNATGKWAIMRSTRRLRSSAWSTGVPIDGFVSTGANDRSVCVTVEGKFPQYLYYATQKDATEGANYDIYVAVRQNSRADWTAPTPLHTVCTQENELHPWLTGDGKQLYFSRESKDGWRVYVAERSKTSGVAGFGEPKLVDVPAGFHHATVAANGQTMYLQGPLDQGRTGLFRSTRTKSGWGAPEALHDLNTSDAPTGDRSPALSSDGMFLYFASDRPGGKGGLDVWVIPTKALDRRGN